jgi:hypothetical protein
MSQVAVRHPQRRIREFFDRVDLDVVCLKKRNAYAIYWADDREPVARLRPTRQLDQVEVDYWDDDKWEPANEPGHARSLDEALEYIAEDPDGRFFDPDETKSAGVSPEFCAAARTLLGEIILCALAGAVVGSLFAGAVQGGWRAALVGLAISAAWWRLRARTRSLRVGAIVAILPVTLVAAAGGVLGGGINGAVAHGVWGPVCGVLAGAFVSVFACTGRIATWLVGFASGLTLAAVLVEEMQLHGHFSALALAAVGAWTGAGIYFCLLQSVSALSQAAFSPED